MAKNRPIFYRISSGDELTNLEDQTAPNLMFLLQTNGYIDFLAKNHHRSNGRIQLIDDVDNGTCIVKFTHIIFEQELIFVELLYLIWQNYKTIFDHCTFRSCTLNWLPFQQLNDAVSTFQDCSFSHCTFNICLDQLFFQSCHFIGVSFWHCCTILSWVDCQFHSTEMDGYAKSVNWEGNQGIEVLHNIGASRRTLVFCRYFDDIKLRMGNWFGSIRELEQLVLERKQTNYWGAKTEQYFNNYVNAIAYVKAQLGWAEICGQD